MSTTTKPDQLQPALVGGLVMGVLSALPLVNLGNLCCCFWVVSGGLELSNVDLGQEFINMILTSTGYSASSRIIRCTGTSSAPAARKRSSSPESRARVVRTRTGSARVSVCASGGLIG